MNPADILRRARMSDSSVIRSRAARVSVELDELADLLLDNPDADAGTRERARLVAALRAERFTPITPRPTTIV